MQNAVAGIDVGQCEAQQFAPSKPCRVEQDNGKSEYVLEPTERVYYPPDVTVDEIDT